MSLRVYLASLLLLLGCAVTGLAQSVSYSLKDGAFRQGGLTMRLQAGQASRLSAPLKLNDGSVLNTSGILVRPDGTRMLLPEGQAVNMQGVVVNLRDDMRTPQAIEQHNKQVTGSTGETRMAAPGGGPAPQALAQQLRQLERRTQLLMQLTDKLADRTAQAVGSAPGAAPIDEQISVLDRQLKP